MLKRLGTVVLFGFALLSPAVATSSPWVLRKGELVISGRFDFQRAEREYLGAGELQDFPLNGRLRAVTYETGARLGVVENVELALSLPLKQISYRADPVILSPCAASASGTECFNQNQANVLNLSRTVSGVGDVRFATRYQFLRSPLVGALEFRAKVPTGYQSPAGTFGRRPKSKEEFADNSAMFVQPENVRDDVTLGDGQVDLGLSALWGWSLPTRTFVRIDSGYLLRLGGAGDQVLANVQVGQQIGKRFLLKVGTNLAYSIQEGDTIGISVAAEDPGLPAEEYEGNENLRLREVPLSSDRLRFNVGLLVRLTRNAELNLSYVRTLWGRNTSRTQTVSAGLGFKFDAYGEDVE